ncbi:tetratricopeptide repeat protein [Desulfosediminicola ganghwensis]|uniref:tetratricopeptide repeat protein n=1 Tax=Desulfosediminicola ganghwensis TaxID=2569540 RepID=UPI0010AD075A|nr:tetratricopeptide repeat protein [Desulfosediminicola ganghwensis]
MKREQEIADAFRVDEAVEAIKARDCTTAKEILQDVAAGAPMQYENMIEVEGAIFIKCWDLDAFFHYLNYQAEHGDPSLDIHWSPGAYPRAYYYLGYLAVQDSDFDSAIEYLNKGLLLEPEHPKLRLEKAQALIGKHEFQAALATLLPITSTTSLVTEADLAAVLRCRAFILIEMGDLNTARGLLHASLRLAPDNDMARDELAYIDNQEKV